MNSIDEEGPHDAVPLNSIDQDDFDGFDMDDEMLQYMKLSLV